MTYINMKGVGGVETVDEFESFREAREMLTEYRIADPYNHYYTSQRSTREWREEGVEQ